MLPLQCLGISNQHEVGHSQEQPRVDDPGNPPGLRLPFLRILQRANPAVEEVIAVVGRKGLAVPLVEHGLTPQLPQAPLAERECEGDDLDGEFPPGPEPRHQFFGPHQDNQATGRRRHDLFPQQGPPITLDQVGRGIDFVGSIDRQVKPARLGERDQGNVQFAGQLLGLDRSGHTANCESIANPGRQGPHKLLRGPPRSQPKGHSRRDFAEGTVEDRHDEARKVAESTGLTTLDWLPALWRLRYHTPRRPGPQVAIPGPPHGGATARRSPPRAPASGATTFKKTIWPVSLRQNLPGEELDGEELHGEPCRPNSPCRTLRPATVVGLSPTRR